ncbi:MAG: hypothetical protein K6G08_08905 [Prevotella sp.]|nr:hypothetical protein [Prevotella sp.]
MKKILFSLVCLVALMGCRQFGRLDLKVQTESRGGIDLALLVKNNDTKSLEDVTITIIPEDSGNEYYYNMDKLPAKERERIPLSKFKDDGGDSFYGKVATIKIESDQGRWESNEDD